VPQRILLAEDNPTNQMLAATLLKKYGHAVTVAPNGKEALAALGISKDQPELQASPSNPPFDLVIMDVQMPEIDGFQTTQLIRIHERHTGSHVPILAMTAHATPGDREKCLAAGMDGYLSKPIQPGELRRAVAALGRKNCRVAGGTEFESYQAPAASQGFRCIDRATALKSVAGDWGLLRLLIHSFLEECPRLFTALRAAIVATDAKAQHIAAHTLKGTALMFGAQALGKAAQQLEDMGRQNDLAQASEAYAATEGEFALAREELTALLEQVQ
jgi:CheY-like chemotaxis protein